MINDYDIVCEAIQKTFNLSPTSKKIIRKASKQIDDVVMTLWRKRKKKKKKKKKK